MKKTKNIEGALLMSVAVLALQGCSSREYTRRCVDAKGNLLPDGACMTRTGGYISPHWIFTHGGTRFSGNRVVGGYETTQPNARIKSSSGAVISTPRGGFGGSSRSFSS